jgi:hypothetical protein
MFHFRFYINLRGKVSIYINHVKHDEAESETNQHNNENATEILSNDQVRERLGNYVTSLGL